MYFIDVQGTLISDEDKSPITGATETIAYLNAQNIAYTIVTNNTKKPSIEFLNYLNSIGFDISNKDYLDPLMLLKEQLNATRVAAYGDELFLANLEAMGYKLDYESPEYVVIGVKKDYSSEDFAQIIEFLLSGAKLLGMHSTTLYAKDGKRYAGTGAILAMLEVATSVPYSIVGKPSQLFYEEAQRKNGADFNDIIMISDDVKGDLVGAKALGMTTVFVLSGKYRTKEEILPLLSPEEQPDYIFQDMREVLAFIKENR